MARHRGFWRPSIVFTSSILFRLALLFYGRYQDSHSAMKYTDIDYLVFTDAARYVAHGRSPYDRATYRYTPLLAWILLPTTWGGLWFEFGKALFAAGDVVAGWLIFRILRTDGMPVGRALKFASIWLLNPMVANISTRGSSEGLLAVLVVALLWAVKSRRVIVGGCLLGLGVHFKIYPFIYAFSIAWYLDGSNDRTESTERSVAGSVLSLINRDRISLAVSSLTTFMGLNAIMYHEYGRPFLEHSYTYHLTRIDHRHNFSVYSTILHLSSLESLDNGFQAESLAFVPQLLLAVIAIPLALAKTDLATTMLAQTFAFVTFNKVCTSQVRWVISHDGAELIVRVVLSMVHGVPAILPATLIPFETACKRPSRTRFLGRWSSFLAAAGVST
ncbi:GPI mannosyltransferase 1 [Fulvia fulva]|uniref:GPI mannosyltransferase 1 n=1 Tax=Passalora fulva TaxID=5499 RepID=A0A9Q8L706_PASFU|nr:GPI mannosyltransferase 1 [Fulvia fulva]KAK4635634.1 GPI mannosyltransferase 1 [Fulvia fulva]KAK4637124.1 GPI mannosyltransferase 1 [Fulvia fulva]UJO11904.1 GPI mannosyltransferase 1 [Fulvia fulva]WPV09027.1 GPI mannosyltransferase 1 [Fulvia fulva]WPV24319.1 GPI mannosyltransferase 1 [Fulvia fulva]